MTLHADKIITKFDGTRELARRLKKPASTVQYWKDKGVIRDIYEEEILAAAAAHGITIEPSDYVQPKAHFGTERGAEMSHEPESACEAAEGHEENGTEIPPGDQETQNRSGDASRETGTQNRGGGGQSESRRRFPGEAGVL